MEQESSAVPHKLLYVDEAGFNQAKTTNNRRNLIDHRATVQRPGQRGSNITLYAAISDNDAVVSIPTVGPETLQLCSFLDEFYRLCLVAGVNGPHLDGVI